MRLGLNFLRSKVAGRIFQAFIFCTLLPVVALTVFAFHHVTRQLDEQTNVRLRQTSKAMAMTVTQRLVMLESELHLIAANLYRVSSSYQMPTIAVSEGMEHRFKGILLVSNAGSAGLFGQIQNPPKIIGEDLRRIRSGKTLITTEYQGKDPSRVFMSVAIDRKRPNRGFIVGEIHTDYLWGLKGENPLPLVTELCVINQLNNILISSHDTSSSFFEQLQKGTAAANYGGFEWTGERHEYLSSYRQIVLKESFHGPQWTVVLSESKSTVLAPMASFKRTFVFVILLTFWIVLLLIMRQIRRSLIPLDQLRRATRRMAMRDFNVRVNVTSGDEFEELAELFNMMAIRLGRQFSALTTIAEIDHTILSSLETDRIVDTLLSRMPNVLPCDGISVTLVDTRSGASLRTFVNGENAMEEPTKDIGFTQAQIDTLRDCPETLVIGAREEPPHYLQPLVRMGMKSFLLLPIFLQDELRGVIGLGYEDPRPPGYHREDLIRVRQLADQVAVTLSNVSLVEELDRQSWASLTALARAIDAISPWTAGHSERVAKLALRIGRELGLPSQELDTLHRGGLIHDIGKIGVPPEVLNKKGKLTAHELKLMRNHVETGVRILEPIAAYVDVLPIVREHHEWWDGNGYPDGLSGEDINIGARIMAVADCFDSLNSDRPYRASMGRMQAIGYIEKGAGKQFDPRVVEAFRQVMEDQKKMMLVATRSSS